MHCLPLRGSTTEPAHIWATIQVLGAALVTACMLIAPVSAGTVVDLTTVADTTITTENAINCPSVCCSDSTVVVGGYEGELWWALMRWDISGSIPAGADIIDVQLEMRQRGSSQTPNPVLAELRPVVAPPACGGCNPWDSCDPTFNNMIGSVGSFGATVGYIIPGLSGGSTWRVLPDVSDELRDWVQDVIDGVHPDLGLCFRTQGSGIPSDFVRFYSSRGGSPARLVIEYDDPPEPADLRVSRVTAPPGPLWRHDPLPVEVCIENIGEQTSGAARVDITLEKVGGGVASYGMLSGVDYGTINADAEVCMDFDFTVPFNISEGTWRVCAEITSGDDSPGNNTSCSGDIIIEEPDPADLVITNASIDGTDYAPGDTLTGSATVQNTGDMISTFFGVDAVLTGPETHEFEVEPVQNQLQGGASATLGLEGEIPSHAAAGTYQVVFRLDAFGDPAGGNSISAGSIEIVAEGPCSPADLKEPFGVLDLADITEFLILFAALDPRVDCAEPFGVWDLADIICFIVTFEAGCP